MGGGLAGLAMHYAGLAMISGVFIGGFVSGIQGSGSVKSTCKRLDK